MSYAVEKKNVNSIGFVSHSSPFLWPRTWLSGPAIRTLAIGLGLVSPEFQLAITSTITVVAACQRCWPRNFSISIGTGVVKRANYVRGLATS